MGPVADAAVASRACLQPSLGDREWPGHRVYLWTSTEAGWLWARRRFPRPPAVIQATLVLGDCLDLGNALNVERFISDVHRELQDVLCEER